MTDHRRREPDGLLIALLWAIPIALAFVAIGYLFALAVAGT